PYEKYAGGYKVLEIGCGLGTMAMNWALNGSKITAVDLNDVAVLMTRKRFQLLNLDGDIHRENANALSFDDGEFDYTYSWGVLHHSPDLEKSISELMRVTKPNGEFGIMLYNRKSILHWYMTEYIEGFLHYERYFLNSLQLASRYGDGGRQEGNPHTWPVTVREINKLIRPYSSKFRTTLLGTELDSIFKYLIPGLGMVFPIQAKKVWLEYMD
ncbi:MAG: class I SAM-dependent methyltransferase, partial [Syntrophomonadaceae bacterium]|nr:class I SAM-dependent methyltransferase [Syntrophomonadaceae bacterium]